MATIFLNQEEKPTKRYLDKGAMEKFMERKRLETKGLKMELVDRDMEISRLRAKVETLSEEKNIYSWTLVILFSILFIWAVIHYA